MKSKTKKDLIKKVLYFIIYISLIIILCIVAIQKVTNNKLSFCGYRIFRVASESMVPEYYINDILVVQKIDTKNIKIGNNISYSKMIDKEKEIIVTHKVIGIEKDSSGNLVFHTKGIANTTEDPIVRENQIYGKVTYKMYFLSLVNKLINNKYGFLILVIMPILILIYLNLKELITIDKEKNDEK